MDPIPTLSRLRDAAYEAARRCGFVPHGFAVTVEDEGPAHVRLLLIHDDTTTPPEKVTLDDHLLAQLATVNAEARKAKADEARRGITELERQLREGDGFL